MVSKVPILARILISPDKSTGCPQDRECLPAVHHFCYFLPQKNHTVNPLLSGLFPPQVGIFDPEKRGNIHFFMSFVADLTLLVGWANAGVYHKYCCLKFQKEYLEEQYI